MRPLLDPFVVTHDELSVILLIARGEWNPSREAPGSGDPRVHAWATGMWAAWRPLLDAPTGPGARQLLTSCRAQPPGPCPKFCRTVELLLGQVDLERRERQRLREMWRVAALAGH